ncbi:uncharacterized protein LOC144341998, partial [Saccoglossus kowalevskii]
ANSSNNGEFNGTSKHNAWVVDIEEDANEIPQLCQISFYKLLKPLFRVMAICGLYRQSTSMSTKSLASTVYGGVVVTLIWGNFIRSTAAIWVETDLPTEIFITRVIACAGLIQCACNASVCFQLCFTNKYQTFFQQFERNCQSRFSYYLGMQLDAQWLKKVVMSVLTVSVIFCVVNVTSSYIFTYGPFKASPNVTLNIFMAPFDTSSHVLIQVMIHITFIFTSAVWIFPISLFCVICLQLSRQFRELKTIISKATQKDGTIKMCLEIIRREHQHLSRSVRHANDLFSLMVLVNIGSNLPLICFLLYELIVVSYPFGLFLNIIIVFWLLITCTMVGIVSWFGAMLHESAHAADHNLHDIAISPGTENHRILEVYTFMAKMNGTPIAITIWNLIPLTKEFILTVIGVLVTYFALVAQTI